MCCRPSCPKWTGRSSQRRSGWARLSILMTARRSVPHRPAVVPWFVPTCRHLHRHHLHRSLQVTARPGRRMPHRLPRHRHRRSTDRPEHDDLPRSSPSARDPSRRARGSLVCVLGSPRHRRTWANPRGRPGPRKAPPAHKRSSSSSPHLFFVDPTAASRRRPKALHPNGSREASPLSGHS